MSVAAVGVPGALAMAQLIGLPSEVGLYACIVPTLAYALFGPSSRFLIVAPDTATCILLAASVSQLGATSPESRAVMASALTLIVAALSIGGAVARLGLVTNLISKAVLVGYLAGIALELFISQLSRLTGVGIKSPGLIRPFVELMRRHAEINWPTVVVGTALFVLLRLLKAAFPRLPAPVIAVIVGIAASWILKLSLMGVAVVGVMPSGLPALRLPSFAADPTAMLEAATGITILSCSSGILTARAFGQKLGVRAFPNRELAGLGIANLAAGLFQTFAVSSSDSRTAVAVGAGSKSALVGIIAAISMAIVAMFLTGPISFLPLAALAAVLASAAIDLFDYRAFVNLARVGREELILALVATAGVVWLGVLPGVIVAVAATLAHLIFLAARPRDGIMGRAPGSGDLVTLHRDPRACQSERILVYLFEASLLFVNADYFADRVRVALRARSDAKWLVLDASTMIHADSAAVETLKALKDELDRLGIGLLIGGGHGRFRDILFRSGLADYIGPECIFTTPDGALAHAEQLRDGKMG